MPIKFTFTNEGQDQQYGEPRQGYPLQRQSGAQLDPNRRRTTEDRHISLVTNDADVDLQALVKSKTGMDIPAGVIAMVAGAVGFMMLDQIVNILVKVVVCAVIAFVCYQMFGKGKGNGAR